MVAGCRTSCRISLHTGICDLVRVSVVGCELRSAYTRGTRPRGTSRRPGHATGSGTSTSTHEPRGEKHPRPVTRQRVRRVVGESLSTAHGLGSHRLGTIRRHDLRRNRLELVHCATVVVLINAPSCAWQKRRGQGWCHSERSRTRARWRIASREGCCPRRAARCLNRARCS